jgi:hypothetical protein
MASISAATRGNRLCMRRSGSEVAMERVGLVVLGDWGRQKMLDSVGASQNVAPSVASPVTGRGLRDRDAASAR